MKALIGAGNYFFHINASSPIITLAEYSKTTELFTSVASEVQYFHG